MDKIEELKVSPPPAESNWDRCKRLAREIDKDELIHDLLRQMGKMRGRRQPLPLWSFVGDATSNGSGVSCGICAIYGVHSDTGAELKEVEHVG